MARRRTPPEQRDRERIEASRMSFGDHLEELRRRILFALLGVCAGMAACLYLASDIIAVLCQPLVVALEMEGQNPRLYQEQVQGLFLNYLEVAFVGGLILASPWVLYQLWKFVASGLYHRERRTIRTFGPASLLLFLGGAAFLYFLVLPFALRYFVMFNRGFEAPTSTTMTPVQRLLYGGREPPGRPGAGGAASQPGELPRIAVRAEPPPRLADGQSYLWIDRATGQIRYYHGGQINSLPPISQSLVVPWFNLADYLKFAVTLMFVFGVGFQTPLVILFLARTGIVPTRSMARSRRVVILVLFIVAAILTPPDVISQVLLAVPMWGLFELGLLLGRRAERRAGV